MRYSISYRVGEDELESGYDRMQDGATLEETVEFARMVMRNSEDGCELATIYSLDEYGDIDEAWNITQDEIGQIDFC